MPVRGAMTLFSVRGIRIGVDYSWFIVLFIVILWLSGFYSSILDAPDDAFGPYALAVASALLFFGSILLHELGHAIVAIRNGIRIPDITLWLFGGVARMSRDSDSPGVEFRVAAAGPAVTVAIAAACIGLGMAIEGPAAFWEGMRVSEGADVSAAMALIGWLATINTLLLVFNMLPAFPLDGGRIARAAAWKLTGDRNRATRFAGTLGQGFSYLFIAIGVLLAVSGAIVAGIWLALIGFILAQAARGSVAQSQVASRIEGISVRDLMDDEPVAIPAEATLEQALDEYFLRYRWEWFCVVDPEGRFRGLVERDAVEAEPALSRASRTVADVVRSGSEDWTAPIDESVEALLGNSDLRRLGALPAVDGDGRLLGTVSADRIAMALRDAVGNRAV